MKFVETESKRLQNNAMTITLFPLMVAQIFVKLRMGGLVYQLLCLQSVPLYAGMAFLFKEKSVMTEIHRMQINVLEIV